MHAGRGVNAQKVPIQAMNYLRSQQQRFTQGIHSSGRDPYVRPQRAAGRGVRHHQHWLHARLKRCASILLQHEQQNSSQT